MNISVDMNELLYNYIVEQVYFYETVLQTKNLSIIEYIFINDYTKKIYDAIYNTYKKICIEHFIEKKSADITTDDIESLMNEIISWTIVDDVKKQYCDDLKYDNIYLSIDGIPEFGKCVEQKHRTVGGEFEIQIKKQLLIKFREEIHTKSVRTDEDLIKYLFETYKFEFSKSNISPNKPFMITLCAQLKELATQYKRLIVSDYNEFGEGERKIILKIYENYTTDAFTKHDILFISPDADVILLAVIAYIKIKQQLPEAVPPVPPVNIFVRNKRYVNIELLCDYFIDRIQHHIKLIIPIRNQSTKTKFVEFVKKSNDIICKDIVFLLLLSGNDFFPKLIVCEATKTFMTSLFYTYSLYILSFYRTDNVTNVFENIGYLSTYNNLKNISFDIKILIQPNKFSTIINGTNKIVLMNFLTFLYLFSNSDITDEIPIDNADLFALINTATDDDVNKKMKHVEFKKLVMFYNAFHLSGIHQIDENCPEINLSGPEFAARRILILTHFDVQMTSEIKIIFNLLNAADFTKKIDNLSFDELTVINNNLSPFNIYEMSDKLFASRKVEIHNLFIKQTVEKKKLEEAQIKNLKEEKANLKPGIFPDNERKMFRDIIKDKKDKSNDFSLVNIGIDLPLFYVMKQKQIIDIQTLTEFASNALLVFEKEEKKKYDYFIKNQNQTSYSYNMSAFSNRSTPWNLLTDDIDYNESEYNVVNDEVVVCHEYFKAILKITNLYFDLMYKNPDKVSIWHYSYDNAPFMKNLFDYLSNKLQNELFSDHTYNNIINSDFIEKDNYFKPSNVSTKQLTVSTELTEHQKYKTLTPTEKNIIHNCADALVNRVFLKLNPDAVAAPGVLDAPVAPVDPVALVAVPGAAPGAPGAPE